MFNLVGSDRYERVSSSTESLNLSLKADCELWDFWRVHSRLVPRQDIRSTGWLADPAPFKLEGDDGNFPGKTLLDCARDEIYLAVHCLEVAPMRITWHVIWCSETWMYWWIIVTGLSSLLWFWKWWEIGSIRWYGVYRGRSYLPLSLISEGWLGHKLLHLIRRLS